MSDPSIPTTTYERVGCITPDDVVMRGHFGPCEQAGHKPIYRRAAADCDFPKSLRDRARRLTDAG